MTCEVWQGMTRLRPVPAMYASAQVLLMKPGPRMVSSFPIFVSLNFQVGFAFNDSERFAVSKYLITCRLLCLEALTARLSLFCLTTERVATSRETSSKTLHSCLDMVSLSFNKHLRRLNLAPLRQLLKDAL